MINRIEDFGGIGQRLILAHANGYPPGCYRQFINCLKPHFSVQSYRQRALWSKAGPAHTDTWHNFADDLIETLESTQSEPVWMMGHSMGGAISVLAAAKRPDLFQGLVLIDPVFMGNRAVLAMYLTPRSRMANTPAVKKTLGRPDLWDSQQQAFDFHRAKRPYEGFSDEALWDFINAGTEQTEDGKYRLAYSKQWEAHVYQSVPWVWPKLRKIKMPVLGLRGEHTYVLSNKHWQRWGRIQPQAVLTECPGGHLLPLEKPDSTAQAVLDYMVKQGVITLDSTGER
jgi:pimeloyl-ACP methyl ester carboxylesterase